MAVQASDGSTASQRLPKGDDWAEKVAGEVAQDMQIPAARIELAERERPWHPLR